MEKKIVFSYIGMAVTLVIGGYIFYLSFIVAQKVDFERVRLERGLISVYQFCSEIGKAAVDQTVCKEFNLLHGNETGQDFWSQPQKDFSELTLLLSRSQLSSKYQIVSVCQTESLYS